MADSRGTDSFDSAWAAMDGSPTTIDQVIEQTRWTMGLFAACGMLTDKVLLTLVKWACWNANQIGYAEGAVDGGSKAFQARVADIKTELKRTWELEMARSSFTDALKRIIAKQHCLITEQPVERSDGTVYWRLVMECRCGAVRHSWPEDAQLEQAREHNWALFLVQHAHA